ncbi:E3 ubiquitin-protein ligase TRIM71-like [Anneissia japonica]|uniref:E3 ubiquitin-protein ligase TRIM71-like n=1 Tax=Anneissia japonica TaxID=1529436 RepID=UPI001425ACAB|nr:E3 ubiquitin-protein ligase TRIM71-like [Anneissia japonica]
MASSELNQFLETVDEKVLECTICFKRLQNPKFLNCSHSFCLACLEDWVKTKGKLTCPTCLKSYSIPQGGLQKLPPNTFVNNLLETIEQISKRDQMKCVCAKGLQAKYYCQECKHYLSSTQLKATWTQSTGETNKTQIDEDDNGDYFVTGKCTSQGICTLNVSADGEPVRLSPVVINVEKEGLVNTIETHQEDIVDVVMCEDDHLLVSCLKNEILKYKQSGEYIGKLTLPQSVKIYRMYNMKNGNIVFGDWVNNYITIRNMNGQLIKSFGNGGKMPHGIHVDEASNIVYVGYMSSVSVYNIDTGQEIRSIGTWGDQEGQVKAVNDFSLTNQRNVLVLDTFNNRLQLFDNEGRFMKVLVRAGDENGKVMKPRGVVVDQDDSIIVSSKHKIQLFSSDGNFIKRIDKEEDGIKDPWGLSVISHHPRRVAVTNRGDKTIKTFNY